jgi:hypothetical protein
MNPVLYFLEWNQDCVNYYSADNTGPASSLYFATITCRNPTSSFFLLD